MKIAQNAQLGKFKKQTFVITDKSRVNAIRSNVTSKSFTISSLGDTIGENPTKVIVV